MNPTQTVIEIDGTPVEVKARMESGRWAVIAFTPVFSIRSNKLLLSGPRNDFARALVYSIFDPEIEDEQWRMTKAIDAVEEAILYVTTNFVD